MVFINGIKPDSNGSVLITFYTGATTAYAMWTSLTIQGMPSPDVIAADSAGTAGVIASSVTRNIISVTGANLLDASAVNALDSSASQRLNTRLAAYPNPFVDNVTVKFGFRQNVGRFTLVVTDDAGRIVQKQEFNNAVAGQWQQTLNLGNLTRGVYFIQLVGLPGEKAQSIKLVKTK